MKKLFIVFGIGLLYCVLSAGQVLALGIEFDILSEDDDDVFVNVVVSGLVEAKQVVTAYDLDVTYNIDVLEDPGIMFGNSIPGSIQESSIDEDKGLITFSELSLFDDPLLPSTGFAKTQNPAMDSVILATLMFEKDDDNDGPFNLQFLWDGVQNVVGLKGEIIIPASPVPEPATLVLLGAGLAGLAGFGRKKFKFKT